MIHSAQPDLASKNSAIRNNNQEAFTDSQALAVSAVFKKKYNEGLVIVNFRSTSKPIITPTETQAESFTNEKQWFLVSKSGETISEECLKPANTTNPFTSVSELFLDLRPKDSLASFGHNSNQKMDSTQKEDQDWVKIEES